MSEIIDKIAKERYLRGDEKTMEDVYRRTAEFVGSNVNLDIVPSMFYRDNIAFEHDQESMPTFNQIWTNYFFDLMSNGIFLPNTPALSNAGTETPMLSACFGLPVNDSFDGPGGIDATEINSRKIFRYGGGVGYNFSALRPKGAKVKSTDGVASGPVSFMRLYDASIGAVKQGGRRRGAAIGILDVDHADIREFVVCKNKEGDFSNFNISVMVTDVFMEHVHDVASKEILDLMVDGIWNNGEPGILFYDTINRNQPNSHLYKIRTTNPCGEVPIGVDPETGGGEACSLASINLTKFVAPNYKDFNWDELAEVVRDVVVFLDTSIDINKFPTPEIDAMVKKTRKIFVGFMGLADAMIMLGIVYGSAKSIKFTKKIMSTMMNAAMDMSIVLAQLRGVFPAYEGSLWQQKGIPIRNSTLTGVAPTGTLSILAECSSGIEPHYNWIYERDNTVGETFLVTVPLFEKRLNEYLGSITDIDAVDILGNYFGFTFEYGNPNEILKEKIIEDCFEKGSIQHMSFLPSDFLKLFVTATDISYQQHIAIQAAAQEFCDNSISKTINMKNDATKEDVRDAIMLAWKSGCKGFTMYREGSRDDVVLKLKSGEKSVASIEIDLNLNETDECIVDGLDKNLPAIYNEVRTGCGILHVIVVAKDGKLRKLFVNCAGAGGCEANNALTGGLVSLLFKNGISRDDIVKRLKMVRCSACIKNQSKAEGKSCGDAIGNVIRDLIPENIRFVKPVVGGVDNDKMIIKVSDEVKPPVKTAQTKICPECGHPISNYEGRCFTCQNCGYAKCG